MLCLENHIKSAPIIIIRMDPVKVPNTATIFVKAKNSSMSGSAHNTTTYAAQVTLNSTNAKIP